jgi:hypothetical protein
VDNNICIHTISITYLGKETPLKCYESGQARKIADEAQMNGDPFSLVNSPRDGVSTVQLGNLDPGEHITISFSMTLVAASASATAIFFKFPLESCSPTGRIVSLDWRKIDGFLFYHEITAFQEIASVTSNLGGIWTQQSRDSGIFQLTKPGRNESLILDVGFRKPVTESLAVRFGKDIATFVMPPVTTKGSGPQEYIFVLDCSGSMRGNRIAKAKACLWLFLHSLPSEGHFNIVRFGNRHDPMWPGSRPVTDDSVGQALRYIQSLRADLGGTELENAVTWILHSRPVFAKQKRQLFILTDGEDFHPDNVMQLVMRNEDKIRCFTVGLGRGADPGLVKGIATRTRGRYDFVHDGVDLRSKVLPQLEAAIAPAIEDVHLQVLGASGHFCIPDQIQSMTPGNLSVVFARCHDLAANPKVLVTGRQQGIEIDYLTPAASDCRHEEVTNAVAKYIESLRLIDLEQRMSKAQKKPVIYDELKRQAIEISIASGIMCPFTSFIAVLPRCHRDLAKSASTEIFVTDSSGGSIPLMVDLDTSISDAKEQIWRATGVPRSHQILYYADQALTSGTLLDHSVCKNSSIRLCRGRRHENMQIFVKGWDCQQYAVDADSSIADFKEVIFGRTGLRPSDHFLTFAGQGLRSGTLRDYSVQKDCTINLCLNLRGAGGCELRISDIEPRSKEHDISDLLKGHSVDGCWLNDADMQKRAGLKHRPTVPDVPPELGSRVRATVIALALLRKYHSDEYELWRLLEHKAMQWLNRTRTGVCWSKIIDKVIAALH